MTICNDELTEYNQIVELIGAENAELLHRRYEGRSLYFSKKRSIQQKHLRILQGYYNDNLTIAVLHERYRYSENHIRRIIVDNPYTQIKHLL